MKIAVKDARLLTNVCSVLLNGTHDVLVKLSNGDTSVAKVPYELDDKVRWNLQKNLALADTIVRDADKRREAVVVELAGDKNAVITQLGDPKNFGAWQTRTDAIEDGIESKPFLRISRKGLKESNTNPIPGFVIRGLGVAGATAVKAKFTPILNDDTPEADAKDVIPDEPEEPAAS